MKKTAFLIIVFIISFIVFAVIKTPAAVAINLASDYLPKDLKIGKASGSVWQGRIMQLHYQGEQINNLSWDISGWALFTGQLTGNLKFGNVRDTADISGRGDFNYGLFDQSISLSDATLRLSVERAMERLQLPLPVKAKGRVIVDLDEYQSGAPYCDVLNGEIASPNIDVQGLSGWFSIGPLSGRLSCKSGDVAVLVDPDNRLGLEADAVLKANLDFKVAGFIKPDATLPKEVHDAAKFLGRADRDGRYPLNF
ncbi:type II secretion system protein N [Pseudoalteromonas shioyasakiensis]|uniref:type II secretion system protein N n=1 Tax=Pseudoalteromonas shioyasakiensis TaxID=1190813 RepID=UPI0021185252|nr:type II secretion system protein N [Pseudoalteromonas shioyasakiensis]MCQ8880137.1 type II secretion system protein N [Pseudoalteromonas shioyasakiensis]